MGMYEEVETMKKVLKLNIMLPSNPPTLLPEIFLNLGILSLGLNECPLFLLYGNRLQSPI